MRRARVDALVDRPDGGAGAAVAKPSRDALVYLGLGVASRAVAVAMAATGWDVPVVANSSLMFGYARQDWRDG